jgi:hypothetical protein
MMRKTVVWGLVFGLAAGPALADSAKVTAGTANVRSGPGVDTRVVASVPRGTVLQVLETSGDWHKVRSADGAVQGWIRSHLVAIVPSAAAPAASPPRAEAAPVAPSVASAGLAIDHKDVSCMVAGENTQLRACFSSPEDVGRAQIHFRALPSSLWYSVELKPDGACHAAWLPRPKKETKQIEYFVFAIDRQFTQTARPESAPGAAFTPRVVARQAECKNMMMGAAPAMGGMAPQNIVVSAARQATGQLLDAATAQSMSAGGLPGFSTQGVVMAGPSAPSSGSPSAGTGAAAGGGIPLWAIVGGAAAAVGGVAVAVGGGGGGSGPGSTASSASGASTSQPATLTGSWSGRAANNTGLSLRVDTSGASCTFRWDMDLTLTQTGTVVTGPGAIGSRSVSCSIPGLDAILGPALPRITESFPFDATLTPPTGISIPLGEVRLVGTYTQASIQATANAAYPEGTLLYTMSVSRR